MWDEYLKTDTEEIDRLDEIEKEDSKKLNKIIYFLMVLTISSFLMEYTYFK